MTLKQELTLAARARAGDKDAVSELWDAITPKLYGYLVNVLREPNLAEDVLQDTWLKALSALSRWQPRGVRFSAWLFAIARNECREHWRTPRREFILPDDEAENIVDSSAEPVPGENKMMLDGVMEKLSPDDQEILRLRYLVGLSFKDIARIQETSVVAARVRTHRALARAREILVR